MPFTRYRNLNGRIRGESTGSSRTTYLTDALGSVTATVDASASVVNTYRNKPYGQRLAKTGSGADPRYQWTGDTGSRVTGLAYAEQYNRARHLGTRQAGWTSVDPLWPAESAYGYVRGNPATWKDPSGKRGCPPAVMADVEMSRRFICGVGGPVDKDIKVTLSCAKTLVIKHHPECSKYGFPKELDGFDKCLENFCNCDLEYYVNCNGSADCDMKGTCGDFNGFSRPGPYLEPINLCPQAVIQNAFCGSPVIVPECATGAPSYGIPGIKPSYGLPPTLSTVLHELMHACATRILIKSSKRDKGCMEAFAEAMTSCLINSSR